MGALALLAVLSVPLSGKDLRRMGTLQVRRAWLLPVALLLQVLVITVWPGTDHRLAVGVHLASYLMAAGFLWANRSIPGLPLLAVGAASNAGTIFLNGGTLPASAAALRTAGLATTPDEFTNSGVLPHPVLPWLGDVFAVPSWVPLANVFSVGDVLVLVGAVLLLHRVCAVPGPAPDAARPPRWSTGAA